ncbi:YjbF family lipoprotein [Aliiroseovarius subalbicans]|uniref:YjbF family lipoprotein n=1 Tax=Aliiroseovarius subalbicans TaxID=2925840 RepID=UPI001F5A0CEC|nr:YjbF family lipoprotein [Aliiroseovarius subalbicans]MCI2397796.1 YjbF family lipoprotein [Aliiroseovarius subalbicans]
MSKRNLSSPPSSPLARAAALCVCLALAACGTDTSKTAGSRAALGAVKSVTGLFAGGGGKAPAKAGPDLADLATRALAATPGPVMLGVVEKYEATLVIAPNASNGDYVTWKTPDLRTFSFKQGVLTSTRGFGDDLMSSQADDAIAMITQRRTGSATRTWYFLSGVGNTTALKMNCSYATGDPVHLKIGAIDARTTPVVETCQRGGVKVQNLYWVDRAGNVVKSRQWISGAMGYFVTQMLRQ